jgi:hypothetical protein
MGEPPLPSTESPAPGVVVPTRKARARPLPKPHTPWERIKEHKVLQWTLAYAAAAYTLLHGTEMVNNAFEGPALLVRLVTIGLVLGIPVAAVLAWYHGHRAQHRLSGPELTMLTVIFIVAGSALWVFVRINSQRAPVASSLAPTAAFRQNQRFQALATRLGLMEYWQQYGPPDDCDLKDGKLTCH